MNKFAKHRILLLIGDNILVKLWRPVSKKPELVPPEQEI
jgi:translation initiation factor IF-1